MSETHAFVDANVLLHCNMLDQIDWCSELGASHVTIICAPVVLRELDKHKLFSPLAKIKKRAHSVQSHLWGLFDSSSTVKLSPKISLVALTTDSAIDFSNQGLSLNVADDWLLASALEYAKEHPDQDVRLVTNDLGITLKARGFGLRVHRPSAEIQRPDEPDANEVLVRKLERELLELKNASPQPELSFGSGDTIFRYSPIAPDLLSAEEIEQRRKTVRLAHKRLEPHIWDTNNILTAGIRASKYNEALDQYFAQYDLFIDKQERHKSLVSRTIEIGLQVTNVGMEPAEDIFVAIRFSKSYTVLSSSDFPEAPAEPLPPELDKTGFGVRDPFPYPIHYTSQLLRSANPSAVDELNQAYFKREKLNHGFSWNLDTMCVVFDLQEDMDSFHLDYEIHAANLRHSVSGTLHVVREGH